jgi:uroporphyrinogen-III synthase
VSDATLDGRRIVVTRAEAEGGTLGRALRSLGARPVHCPVLQVTGPEDEAELRQALERLPEMDWLVLTSPRAVEALDGQGVFVDEAPEGLQIAVVGARTEEALEERGWRAHVVPRPAGAIPLLLALQARDVGRGARILFPASEKARTVLPDGLRDRGARVYQVVAYRPAPAALSPQARAAMGGADAVTFTSPSAVNALVESLGDEELAALRELPAGVQGPTTGRAAREAGWTRLVEAEPRTFQGLAAALAREIGPAPTSVADPRPDAPLDAAPNPEMQR